EALPPAARGGLDRERPAELGAEPDDFGRRLDRLGRSRDDRDAGGLHPLARLGLRAHRLDRLRRRPDPGQTGALDGAGERRVLGQEPVPGVHRLGSGLQRRLDDSLLVQVALGRRAAAEQPGLVGDADVECGSIRLRVDGHRVDLAAVGYEDFREGAHRRRILHGMIGLADQLTLARIVATPFVVILFIWDFPGHAYWATALFITAMATDQIDGWLARRQGRTTPLGSLLDPVADKVLVLATMIVLVGEGAFPGWMVAAIVARELLVSGLRLAAVERGVVLQARDLGKLKTWSQAVAAALGGFAVAGAWSTSVAWWGLLVAVVLTWVSGLDYARDAPALLRGRALA